MSIEAYQIGVSFVADATKVSGPIGEMLRGMDRILERQKDVNMGFVSMVSSLGGARRLAGGLASELERAAKAARDVASASGRFRPASASSGSASTGSNQGTSTRNSSRTSADDMALSALNRKWGLILLCNARSSALLAISRSCSARETSS